MRLFPLREGLLCPCASSPRVQVVDKLGPILGKPKDGSHLGGSEEKGVFPEFRSRHLGGDTPIWKGKLPAVVGKVIWE